MAKIGTLFGAPSTRTFLGVEACTPAEVLGGAVAIVGLPGATPYASAGAYCAKAPAAIRSAISGYAGKLTHYDFDIGGPLLPAGTGLYDAGDLSFDLVDFAANRARIRATIADWVGRGVRPVVLGGDDSVQIPILEAFAAAGAITVLQIDAHIDWRDEVQGERCGLSSTMRRASEMAGVKTIVQVGARASGSARPSDVADALAYGAHLFDMRRVRRDGMAPIVAAVPVGRPVVVCLDVDGLDPSIVPAVIGRAPGGLGYGDIVELIAGVAARAPIVGFNIVELVPENDVDGQGALVAGRLAILGIGHVARSTRRGSA